MYFAGNFDFSSDNASINKQSLLKFPVRVPLEKVINIKKRQREDTQPSDSTSAKASSSSQLLGASVSCIATGAKHVVCVINGTLYGMGSNKSHQLGGGNLPNELQVLRELPLLGLSAPIVKVACGRKHTMALTANGELYTTGDNSCSQLGHSNRKGDWAIVRVGTNNVTHIATGPDASFALTADGHVYSWGCGESLSLGHPITRIESMHPTTLLPIFINIDLPTRIEGFVTKRTKILEISAGTEHLVARDEKDVYTCGQNSFGKLGTGDVQDQLTPYRVQFPEKKTVERLLQVLAVGRCTMVLKHNPDFGNITYIFGKEGSNQDGTLVPRIVTDAPLSIARLCGGGFNTQMCSAVTNEGLLYTWGHSTSVSNVMRTCDHSHSAVTEVELLNDKAVIKDCVSAGGTMMIAIADVEATVARAGNGFATDSLLADVVVPYDKRIPQMTWLHNSVDNYDQATEAFYKQLLGEVDGSRFYSEMTKAPPYDPNANRPKINKQGTRVLRNGSKVRVWMTDVYALGTVTNANPLDIKSTQLAEASSGHLKKAATPLTPMLNNSHAPAETLESADAAMCGPRNHHFEITWVRDDWDPEIIELYSDDETLDEENENRWQKLWFAGAPTSNSL